MSTKMLKRTRSGCWPGVGRSCSKTAGVVHDDELAAFEDEAMRKYGGDRLDESWNSFRALNRGLFWQCSGNGCLTWKMESKH